MVEVYIRLRKSFWTPTGGTVEFLRLFLKPDFFLDELAVLFEMLDPKRIILTLIESNAKENPYPGLWYHRVYNWTWEE